MPHKRLDPTPEQVAVISSEAQRLVVHAAAGAGKTFVLVERYLRLVAGGLSPDQILTITFTRKAAAEMKRRIVDALRDQDLLTEAQQAETGPIQTIHSFCERLLRENALEAGLDPEYTILGGAHTAQLMEESVREAIAYPPDNPHALKLIEALAGRRSFGGSQHTKLTEAVIGVLKSLRGTAMSPRRLAEEHDEPASIVARWREHCLADAPPEVRERMPEDDRPFFTRVAQAYKDAGKTRPRWLRTHPDTATLLAGGDEESAKQACGLAQVAAQAWSLLEQKMEQRQALDFASLELRAVELLSRSEATRSRIATQYRAVLVDEAQDVNPMQYRLLDALPSSARMFVGDPQQSIYAFRQADVELFRALIQEEDSQRLSLNLRSDQGILAFVDRFFTHEWAESYVPMRAQGEDLDLSANVIETFSGVEFWRQKARDSYAVALALQQLLQGLNDEGLKAKDVAVLVRKRAYAVDLLPKLEELGMSARIVGGTERFYTRMEVRDLANVLRCVGDPSDDYALLCTLRSPVADLSLDSIVMLAYRAKGESAGVAEILPSFEPPIEQDRPKLDDFLGWYLPLKGYGDRLAAWEVLSSLFAATPFLERLASRKNGHRQIANARKLLALAVSEPELGPLAYEARVREIQEIRHSEGDAPSDDESENTLTLMTVHAAKGLEFPVVVLPEMHWMPKSDRKEVEVDPRLGTFVAGFKKRPSNFHDWMAARRHERERQEEDRLLYVAMTRAKKRLCLCVHPQAPHGFFAARIARVFGYKDTPPPLVHVRDLDASGLGVEI
ncbi:MAG TPA: UvrD-helicase domain-containing protein [Fimbriimonadaceae bacterium]|nr:UvrD-helicase domain-containing protein [Fimbriimonadaceae bacterium]